MTRATPRRSRRWRTCESCRHHIAPGDLYLSHVASPGHGDLGNVGWWRSAECVACATRYGRGWLVAS